MRSHMRLEEINVTVCAALVENVSWFHAQHLSLLFLLITIDILVIIGNVLVIIAIFSSSLLRSVTNFFIISLAFADLMVGLSVLPFSAMWETYKIWIFGDIWCSIWLAIDVWMCTASILNLCAISLDRYLAVTRPVTYPNIMTPYRAKILIASVWILSFVICLPPLIGWRDDYPKKAVDVSENVTDNSNYKWNQTVINLSKSKCQWKCELTNQVGYVVYSALGSFYIPMFVMLFFYWKIYRAAIKTTRAINQGFRTTKGVGTRTEAQRLTLRIHRGRKTEEGSSPLLIHNHNHNNDNNQNQTSTKQSVNQDVIKICVRCPSNEEIQNDRHFFHTTPSSSSLNPDSTKSHLQDNNGELEQRATITNQAGSPISIRRQAHPAISKKKSTRKRILKVHAKTFRTETKAAKTLGIIVGGFIICWLPFFTMYLTRAFYPEAINPLLFSILFWLGYCNSAINPMIYALFSTEFRYQFQKILYKFFCCKTLNKDRNLVINYQIAKKVSIRRSTSSFSKLPDNNIEMKELVRCSSTNIS